MNVYLDYNATTPLHPAVQDSITDSLATFGNPSSMHSLGRESREKIENARETVASFINAQPEEIVFVGSGSEANNTVINVVTDIMPSCQHSRSNRRGIITSTIEHPCVLETIKCLEQRGARASYIAVDGQTRLKLDDFEDALSNQTSLVTIMMANNETGTVQDIATIAKLTHKYGALVHTDAIQAVGKIPVDVQTLDVDFLSLSAHKIYGPKGVAALYVRKGTDFCPFIRGGHQEAGRRAGTENTLGIVALATAIEQRAIEMDDEAKRLLTLKGSFAEMIKQRIPDITINGHQEHTLPGTLNVSFAGAEGESILLYLDLEGISASTGSACASGSLDPSHVLLASGLAAEQAHGSIRFSLGRDTTQEELDYTTTKLQQIIARLRAMSTLYKGETS
jgi:cysteine desulfurase